MDPFHYVLKASKLICILPYGFFGWILWGIRSLFSRKSNDNLDFEKKLKHLSKEEIAIHSRMKTRYALWRKLARSIILYSCVLEVLFVFFGIWCTKNEKLSWQSRSLRISPIFLFPAFSYSFYISLSKYFSFCKIRDSSALERLRAERKAKIDELKEKTNYYRTQELIQQYDLDPAAQAAAATALVSKLGGRTSFPNQFPKPQSQPQPQTAGSMARDPYPMNKVRSSRSESKSPNPEEVTFPDGMRRRKSALSAIATRPLPPPGSPDPSLLELSAMKYKSEGLEFGKEWGRDATSGFRELEQRGSWEGNGHDTMGTMRSGGGGGSGMSSGMNETSLFSRIAALLVGEDPTQCYALICEKCRSHNGLAKKEDFPYIAYLCPRCNHFNPGEHHHTSSFPSTPRSTPPSQNQLQVTGNEEKWLEESNPKDPLLMIENKTHSDTLPCTSDQSETTLSAANQNQSEESDLENCEKLTKDPLLHLDSAGDQSNIVES